jgi:hypothetical protein
MILAVPLLLASLTFIGAPAASGMTENTQREEAVVEFTETVRLQGVLLRGQYLILHDNAKMAAGEPCLYVYTMKAGKTRQASHRAPLRARGAQAGEAIRCPTHPAKLRLHDS